MPGSLRRQLVETQNVSLYLLFASSMFHILCSLVLGNRSLLLWKTNYFALWAIERKRNSYFLLHVWRFTASFVLPLAQTYMASRLFHLLAIECTEPANDPEMSCNHMQSSFVLAKSGPWPGSRWVAPVLGVPCAQRPHEGFMLLAGVPAWLTDTELRKHASQFGQVDPVETKHGDGPLQ